MNTRGVLIGTCSGGGKGMGCTNTWENSLMPTSVTTADREILAGPAKLHALFKDAEKIQGNCLYSDFL